jgi:hypothetical protein
MDRVFQAGHAGSIPVIRSYFLLSRDIFDILSGLACQSATASCHTRAVTALNPCSSVRPGADPPRDAAGTLSQPAIDQSNPHQRERHLASFEISAKA